MSNKECDDSMPQLNEELKTKKDKYKVLKLLGKGGFGAVYSVQRLSDSQMLAIKCEKADAVKKSLFMDCNVLKGAAEIKSHHFCALTDRAAVKDRFNFIVMKMIGRNLWDLRLDMPDHRFTLGTALKTAAQCLVSIEELHRFGYLHRDIKPGNFAAGRKETKELHIIYMLDFGLCREYVKRREGKIRMQRSSAPFRGTTRYAPLASMMELDIGRKDDIESWLYMVVEWTSGQLIWHKYRSQDRDKVLQYKKDLREKPEVQDNFLAHCPKKEYLRIFKYLETLGFYSSPDYKFIFYCIQHAASANNIKDKDPLDWDPETPYSGPNDPPGDGNVINLDVERIQMASSAEVSLGTDKMKTMMKKD
uniref:Protein kinase domain-containing protein n=1 Tax=Caenorhabditis japonica TaxID=281687 RepID=A0A8R1HXM6_CAEJA